MENYSTLIKEKRQINPSKCKICGSEALYSYFDVVSCHPCKVFFKRNGQYGKELLKCHFDNKCEINLNNRRVCPSCRLKKCFKQGMKIEMIRPSRINKDKTESRSKHLIKSNQNEHFRTLNLLEKDNSSLDNNQRILLSNIINSYDQSKLFSITKRLKNSIELNKSIIINSKSIVEELITSFYEIAGKYICLNNDITNLSSDNRSILLHTASDNVTCLGGIFILYHSHLIYDQIFWNYIQSLYGKLATKYHRWSAKLTESDIILFKLAMSLFSFSSTSRIFYRNISIEYKNLKEILNIENKYCELTWKYLMYKYGYDQAIKKYFNLIQWMLSVTVVISYSHYAEAHVNDIQSLIQQTELTLILDDVDKIIQTDK